MTLVKYSVIQCTKLTEDGSVYLVDNIQALILIFVRNN